MQYSLELPRICGFQINDSQWIKDARGDQVGDVVEGGELVNLITQIRAGIFGC
jgi:hypothetical protein